MKLTHLTNKILLKDIKTLVAAERRSSLQILFHLKEIDKRKLFSDLKYRSLFDYCLRELKYSESAALRRITAARLLNDIPELAIKIETGLLSLTNITEVAKTTKDTGQRRILLKAVEGLSKRECEKMIFKITGEVLKPKEGKSRISKDEVHISMNLSDETLELMDKVKGLIGKNLSSDDLIKFAMIAAIEKIEKVKFKQTKKPHSPPPAAAGRYVQAYVKREVYKTNPSCERCGSIYNLNFDHIKAHAHGGSSKIENIRILCFHCNQRERMRAGL